jgi:hypothetical protein
MKRSFDKTEPFGVVDGGGNKLYVRYGVSVDDVAPMTRADFMKCDWLSEERFRGIKQFAGEYAHLAVPQTETSLAQIYSANQLMEIYNKIDSAGVSLFYLPEKQVRKVTWDTDQEYAAKEEKTDEMDTLVWYRWLKYGHTDNLQPAIRDHANHAKKGADYSQLVGTMNVTLNAMRHGKYMTDAMYTESEFFPDGFDHAVKFIKDWCSRFNCDRAKSAPERSKCFRELLMTIKVDEESVNRGVKDILVNRAKHPMTTAVAALINPRTGEIHRKSNGKFRSVDEIMRALGSSPNHGKMGVARSNLYWHLARNVTIARCKKAGCKLPSSKKREGPFRQSNLTDEQRAIHRATLKDVKHATRLCVRYVQKCLQGSRVSDMLF